jgi:hypothetical protein
MKVPCNMLITVQSVTTTAMPQQSHTDESCRRAEKYFNLFLIIILRTLFLFHRRCRIVNNIFYASHVRAISDMTLRYVIVGRFVNGSIAFRLMVVAYLKVNIMIEIFRGNEAHTSY